MINDFRGEHYYLSNFYKAPVKYEGILYQNNEAAFQAMKVLDLRHRKSFKMLNPSQAKSKGRRVTLRPDWEDVKECYMYKIVKAKFEQNPILKEKLLSTGNKHLEEGNTWGDRTWGTTNGIGQNKLGIILMQVREEFKMTRERELE